VTWAEVIEAVEDFRRGAARRRDSEKWGSGEQVFFDGKVYAYDDLLSWLRDRQRREQETRR